MGTFVKNRQLQSGSSGVVLPTGSTINRPLTPVFGLIRYNTDLASIEFFNGTQFINLTAPGEVDYVVDSFVGDGTTSIFTMSIEESSASQIIVFVGSIYQDSTSAYTVNGGYDIMFKSPPPDGEPISVIHSTTTT